MNQAMGLISQEYLGMAVLMKSLKVGKRLASKQA